MKVLFTIVITIHGLIHLMGFVKGFGLAAVPQLIQPISKTAGVIWLVACLLILSSALGVFVFPRTWWLIGGLAVLVSQVAILTSWSDAKFGTLGNVLLLIGSIYGFLSLGHNSFQAVYERALDQEIRTPLCQDVLREADLAHLPKPLRDYIRLTGAVGQPRIYNFQANFKGRIRGKASARWMAFHSQQFNSASDAKRIFHMRASLFGIPFDVLHHYRESSSTMNVKIASAFPIVEAKGPELLRPETVTVLNDFCVLAPGALPFMNIKWEEADGRTVKATYTNAGEAVTAFLVFGDSGELVDFYSDDRLMASSDGKSFTKARWQTPLSNYRKFGAYWLASHGETRWRTVTSEFTYGEFELQALRVNVGQAATK